MNNYSVVKLIFNDDKGNEHLRLYRSIAEAKDAIKLFRKMGLYHSYRIKVVKYK